MPELGREDGARVIEGLPVASIAGAGAGWTLAGLCFWLVFTGRLVSKSHVDDVRADRDVRVAEAHVERDEWKATAQIRTEQVGVLIEQGKTTEQLLRAMQPPGAGS